MLGDSKNSHSENGWGSYKSFDVFIFKINVSNAYARYYLEFIKGLASKFILCAYFLNYLFAFSIFNTNAQRERTERASVDHSMRWEFGFHEITELIREPVGYTH